MFIYVPQGDHQTYLTFASKAPHKTRFLAISFMDTKKPHDLINDLRDVGWAEENASLMPLAPISPLNGRYEVHLFAHGSGLFDMWTDDEQKKHMANARRVLRKYGITGVPHRKLTLADMM